MASVAGPEEGPFLVRNSKLVVDYRIFIDSLVPAFPSRIYWIAKAAAALANFAKPRIWGVVRFGPCRPLNIARPHTVKRAVGI